MTVSVLIPHYGDAAPTLALVAALADQADQIIVVDDCSPVAFPGRPGVEVVRRDRNGGFGQAVNSGLARVTSELTLILNSDLEVGPTFVADLVAAAAPYMPCVAGPRIVDPYGGVAESARTFPSVTHQVVEWLTPLARWRDTPRWHRAVGHDLDALGAAQPIETDWLVGAALLAPTADLRAEGGFDARFYMNAEEVDLQRRLRARGVPSVYVPTVTVVHEGGGSSDPAKRRAWLVASRWAYADKWGGSRALVAGLTLATGANLLWNAVRKLRGQPVDPWAVAAAELRLIRDRAGSVTRTDTQEPA